ncbi:hypothetical protein ACIPLC_23255 [Kitasatospora sp. NPDC086801]|uniref:hypothetical protein n=1 Tax=Kitasatospora sp. NPDC086801 TaxID=3364066 RepID=UPI00380C5C92
MLGTDGCGLAPPEGFPPSAGGDEPADGEALGLGPAEGEAVPPPCSPDPPLGLGPALGSRLGRVVAGAEAPPEGEGSEPRPPPVDGRSVGGASCGGEGFGPTVPPKEVPLPDSPFTVADTGCPVASSNARIGVIATTNTSPDTAAQVFQLHRRRARTTCGSFHSEEIAGGAGSAGRSGTWRSPFAA